MFSRQRGLTSCLALAAALSASAGSSAFAGESIIQAIDTIGESITAPFVPGTLVLSRSVYTANPV
jgi:hypothetical protein